MAGNPIDNFVKKIVKTAQKSIQKNDLKSANLAFMMNFDVRNFGRRCILDHWNTFNETEKTEYTQLLNKNLQKRMQEKLILDAKDSFDLRVSGIGKDYEGYIKINNVLKIDDREITLSIVVYNNGKNYQIIDYELEGVLLSRQYRGQFNRIMRKHGKQELFKRLKAKVYE